MTVGVVGLGLIGGSIALAFRDPARTVLGFEPHDENAQTALARDCVNRLAPLDEVAQADIVFVCVPPRAVETTLDALQRVRASTTIVTDVTSVKAPVVAWGIRNRADWFVPGHPMAGHERSGPGYASGWLFRHAKWILCPTTATSPKAVRTVQRAVQIVEAIPVVLPPEQHDQHLALLSHLPHVLASALVRRASELDNIDVAGPSWRDLTRVGGAEPVLWEQILVTNATAVRGEIRALRAILDEVDRALDEPDELRRWLQEAAAAKHAQTPAESQPKGGRRR